MFRHRVSFSININHTIITKYDYSKIIILGIYSLEKQNNLSASFGFNRTIVCDRMYIARFKGCSDLHKNDLYDYYLHNI